MQIKIPKFQLAHRGSLLRLQSAQTRFADSLRRFLMTAWFAAALSAAGLGRRDMKKGSELEGVVFVRGRLAEKEVVGW